MKKHIVCFGDSNTHGYCPDPGDCADGGGRFNESERWPMLLQKALGDGYLVIEEGLSGRTTCLDDPFQEGMNGLSYLYPCLKSHGPVDLLVIMLGTNDCKDRFHASAACIGLGLARLVKKAQSCEFWAAGVPNILVVAPPPIGEDIHGTYAAATMGQGCVARSRELAHYYRLQCEALGCRFLDAAGCEFNRVDYMHLTRRGHAQLAERLTAIMPELL